MYVGRELNRLESIPLPEWSVDELSYYRDTLQRLQSVLNADGKRILQNVSEEISARGGLPAQSGDYDHPSTVHYD